VSQSRSRPNPSKAFRRGRGVGCEGELFAQLPTQRARKLELLSVHRSTSPGERCSKKTASHRAACSHVADRADNASGGSRAAAILGVTSLTAPDQIGCDKAGLAGAVGVPPGRIIHRFRGSSVCETRGKADILRRAMGLLTRRMGTILGSNS
jgi:hypothetical protein